MRPRQMTTNIQYSILFKYILIFQIDKLLKKEEDQKNKNSI